VLDQINIQYYSIPSAMNFELENDSIDTFVVLNQSDWVEETQILLLKMLKAVKLEDNQFQIVQVPSNESVTVQSLIKQTSKGKILIFGLSPQQVHTNIKASLYEPIQFETAKLLFSDSLGELIAKPALKKPLWSALQTLFS